jgi:antitoxin YefM
MDALSYSDAHAGLNEIMDRVIGDHSPVIITRANAEAVVIVSLADWSAMEETTHLLSSPRNAKRLKSAIRQLDGEG